ncbi:hypothetical protein HANVADRAFT_52512 [Hanseniaspora valbyensis NRRL Y-1626]|uniref:Svf1-like N-terminal domain-containing protein n=1 Tax=Hanseniaspora valbyensis NRRL Y-1626 TaxID=766949 RepID=A0A1B7TEX6_9ASCO|nr:hypothetical protein HANVADRAFT_52512 [Hanseniaspora valbyensis NRRL Y-1626]
MTSDNFETTAEVNDIIDTDNYTIISATDISLHNPLIFKQSGNRKSMLIETHTFYIHLTNKDIIMIQILMSNILDGLSKTVEFNFKKIQKNNKENYDSSNDDDWVKIKLSKPFDIDTKSIKTKELTYIMKEDGDIFLELNHESINLKIDFDLNGTNPIFIKPNGTSKLANGEIKHLYTTKVKNSRESFINFKNKNKKKEKQENNNISGINIDENSLTTFIIATQKGFPFRLANSWNFLDSYNEKGENILLMEYEVEDCSIENMNRFVSFYIETDSNNKISVLKNNILLKSRIQPITDEQSNNNNKLQVQFNNSNNKLNLCLVKEYRILDELPGVVRILMKKMTSIYPVLKQYIVDKNNESTIVELTTMKG